MFSCCFNRPSSNSRIVSKQGGAKIVTKQPTRRDEWEKGFKFDEKFNLVLRVGASKTEVSLNKDDIITALKLYTDKCCMSTEQKQKEKFIIEKGGKNYSLAINCLELKNSGILPDSTNLKIIIAPDSNVYGDIYADDNAASIEFNIENLKEGLGISNEELAEIEKDEIVTGFNEAILVA